MFRTNRIGRASITGLAVLVAAATATGVAMANTPAPDRHGLDPAARQTLTEVGARTWKYFTDYGVDPHTHLPRAEVGPTGPLDEGDYTSGTMIGLYLDAIVSARDLKLITPDQAAKNADAVLGQVEKLQKWQGFPLRWYSTKDGSALNKSHNGPLDDKGFVSTVDDAWYAQGLVVARQAFPSLAGRTGALLDAMDWRKVYDPDTNTLANGLDLNTGQLTPAKYRQIYAGPRIADYIAVGSKKVDSGLWFGPWRIPPRLRKKAQGGDVGYRDPASGKQFTVWEGHLTYQDVPFVPTFQGSTFEALAPALVVPEKLHSHPGGLDANNRNTAVGQVKCGADEGIPVWGQAPGQDPDADHGYKMFGCKALATTPGKVNDYAVTPYSTLLAAPYVKADAVRNVQALQQRFPGLYTEHGFFDAVDPHTGSIAKRYMAVSQASVLAGIDDAVNDFQLEKYYDADSYGKNVRPYLELENLTVTPAR